VSTSRARLDFRVIWILDNASLSTFRRSRSLDGSIGKEDARLQTDEQCREIANRGSRFAIFAAREQERDCKNVEKRASAVPRVIISLRAGSAPLFGAEIVERACRRFIDAETRAARDRKSQTAEEIFYLSYVQRAIVPRPAKKEEMRYWKAATRWKLCWKYHLIHVCPT